MKTHKLKIESKYFMAVFLGHKTFEIRKNDRDFKCGDTVILKEYEPLTSSYTGRLMNCTVGYVCNYAQRDNHVVFSLLAPGGVLNEKEH